MAITAKTMFTNPAVAALSAASLLSVAVVGAAAFGAGECPARRAAVADVTTTVEDACSLLVSRSSGDSSRWAEHEWVNLAECYGNAGDAMQAVEVTREGLKHHRRSEALYVTAGYYLVEAGEHAAAVHTLRRGLRVVGTPKSGVLANNLAWSGLWAPREMELERARALYRSSLRATPGLCATLHTGLWVEYAIASSERGLERATALRSFHELRGAYRACEDRVESGQRRDLVEVMGAAVLYAEVERTLDRSAGTTSCSTNKLMRQVASELQSNYRGTSVDDLCREASPLASAHHACVGAIDGALSAQRRVVRRAHHSLRTM